MKRLPPLPPHHQCSNCGQDYGTRSLPITGQIAGCAYCAFGQHTAAQAREEYPESFAELDARKAVGSG